MAQHDYIIANQSGAGFRSDLNNGLAAIVSQNSGAAQPSTTYAYQWWADTTTGLLKIRNAANNAWITIGTLADANLGIGTPAGTITWHAANTAPTGYLKANGASISRSTYAALFAAIGTTFGVGNGSTTFTLPDLRGEFIRGWADGRAVDTGRTFASFQDQAYLSHAHGVSDPGHAHTLNYSTPLYGADNDRGASPSNFSIDSNVTPITLGAFTGIGIQNSGGAETRPRNVALLACIKF